MKRFLMELAIAAGIGELCLLMIFAIRTWFGVMGEFDPVSVWALSTLAAISRRMWVYIKLLEDGNGRRRS